MNDEIYIKLTLAYDGSIRISLFKLEKMFFDSMRFRSTGYMIFDIYFGGTKLSEEKFYRRVGCPQFPPAFLTKVITVAANRHRLRRYFKIASLLKNNFYEKDTPCF